MMTAVFYTAGAMNLVQMGVRMDAHRAGQTSRLLGLTNAAQVQFPKRCVF
jgi:hypothetical protein